MSLEIVILGADGSPAEQVYLGVDTHWELMEVIKERSDSILLRMEDYYGDAYFESNELDNVIQEIEGLSLLCKEDSILMNVLTAFKRWALSTKAQGKPLNILAD